MSIKRLLLGLFSITTLSKCTSDNRNNTSSKAGSNSFINLKDSILSSDLNADLIAKSIFTLDSASKAFDIKNIANINLALYDSFVAIDKTKLAIAFLDNTLQIPSNLITDTLQYRYYSRTLAYKAYEMEIIENFAECKELLEELLLLNKKWNVNNNSIYTNLTLGNINTRYGDYNKAVNYLNKCKEESLIKEDKINYNRACNSLAVAYKYQGKFDLAIENLKEVQGEAELYSKTFSCIELADNYLALHKYPETRKKILNGMQLVRGLEEADMQDLSAELYSISGAMQKELGNLDAALSDFNNAVKLKALGGINPASREFAKLYLNLGTVYFRKSMLRNSMSNINRSLNTFCSIDTASLFSVPTQSQLYSENTILDALDLKAEVLQSLYNQTPDLQYLSTAILCYTLSFEVEKKLMQYFSYDESKLLMLNESRQRSQKAINLCYQLYQLTKDNQWARKAFEFAEKNKAFVLLESVKRNLASNAALQNDTLYQKVQSLQLQLAYTERSLAEATGDSAKQKIQQQKTKLENDLLFANTALGRQSVAYKAVMEKEDSISAASVSQGLLNEHTGLIEFFNADSVTYAFVLNKEQPIQFIRYNANLAPAIDSLLYFFRSASAIGNQPLAYQKAAYDLYQILQFDKLDKGWQNLIIIPDGKLSFLPFDALITNTSFTINLQQAKYFINQCNTLYGYSAAILLKQLHNDQSTGKSTTVFAPVFSNGQNHQQPLQYSLQEAEAIAANKNTTSFVKEKATLANFRQQFNNSGIMHIATHAYADTGTNNNPKIEFIDSSLLLNELYAMHTNASLVVLSACETGLGKLNSSEGPMSLARGFYYAGAKNVITSYWNVDDKSTATLFGSVYENMKSSSSADAIHLAKKELIKTENGKFASPYYWAGFVHIGMPQKKESRNYWWALLMIPLIMIVFYYLKPNTHPPTSTTRIP